MERRAPPGNQGLAYGVARLRQYAGADVRVRLEDGTTWSGRLRTDLLTERSLSVYITGRDGEGATLYIDQIAEIVRTHASAGD